MPINANYFTWNNHHDAEVITWEDLVKYRLTDQISYVNGELGFTLVNIRGSLAWFRHHETLIFISSNTIYEQRFYCNQYDTFAKVLYRVKSFW